MYNYKELLDMGLAVISDGDSMESLITMMAEKEGIEEYEAILRMEEYIMNLPNNNKVAQDMLFNSNCVGLRENQTKLLDYYMSNNITDSLLFHHIITRYIDRDTSQVVEMLLLMKKYKNVFDYEKFFKHHDNSVRDLIYDISSPNYYLASVLTALGTYRSKFIYANAICYFHRLDRLDHDQHSIFIIVSFLLKDFDPSIKAILDNHIKNFMFSRENSRRFAGKYFETFVRKYRILLKNSIPVSEFDDYVNSELGIKTNKIVKAEMNQII